MVKDVEEDAGRYRVYARAVFPKDKRVNIRIRERVARITKVRPAVGISYQALIAGR